MRGRLRRMPQELKVPTMKSMIEELGDDDVGSG